MRLYLLTGAALSTVFIEQNSAVNRVDLRHRGMQSSMRGRPASPPPGLAIGARVCGATPMPRSLPLKWASCTAR
eukprot:3639043-Pleurochrysis_carterae.AAC.1